MRAIVCDRLGDPSVLHIEERPIPEAGPGEIVVKVGAASVNFPDVLMVAGGYQHKPELPFVPGMEGAGTIHAVGADVTSWKPGDRVIFGIRPGAFAEYVKLKASGHLMRLPDDWSFAEGVGLPCRRADRLPFAGPSRRAEEGRDRCWSMARRAASASRPCSSASISVRA